MEAPVAEPQVEQPAPSAPAEAAPDLVTTTERGGVVTHEFRNPDAGEKIETPPAPVEKQAEPEAKPEPEATTAPPASEQAATPGDDVEAIVKDPRVQARIEQLANNRVGNVLQRERDKLRAEIQRETAEEAKAWETAEEAYQVLAAKGRDAFMQQYGLNEPDAARWEADFLAERERRAAGQSQAQATQAVESRIRQDFNTGAISELRGALPDLLPFYADLGEETRTVIDNLKYDPNGNWLGDALGALVKGIAARDQRIDREHKQALEEAKAAGKNAALAEREEASPLIVEHSPSNLSALSNAELDMAYGEGSINRAAWQAENKRRGRDY